MMSTMRVFVCLEPPEDAVEHLDEFLAVAIEGRQRAVVLDALGAEA